jgi:hypothetical protein
MERQRALPAQTEGLAAGDEERQAGRFREQRGHRSRRGQHLFEVVQHEEQATLPDKLPQRLGCAAPAGVRRPKRPCDGGEHHRGLADG